MIKKVGIILTTFVVFMAAVLQSDFVKAEENIGNLSTYLKGVEIVSQNSIPYDKDKGLDLESLDSVEFKISFSESKKEFNDNGEMYYLLPEGVTPIHDATGEIMNGDVKLGTYRIAKHECKIYISIAEEYQGTGTKIENCYVDFVGKLKLDNIEIDHQKNFSILFGIDVILSGKTQDPTLYNLAKIITDYNADTHIASYKIQLTDVKTIQDIQVRDVIGTDLEYFASSFELNNETVKENEIDFQKNSFLLVIKTPTEEEYTLTYKAHIKDRAFQGDGENLKVTPKYVDNKVEVTSKDARTKTAQADLATDQSSKDKLTYTWLTKNGIVDENQHKVTYSVTINPSHSMNIAGKTVKDTLDKNSPMNFSGTDEVTVEKTQYVDGVAQTPLTDKGTFVDLGFILTSGKEWTYKIPETDNGNYQYKITYVMTYDPDSFIANKKYNNTATLQYDGNGYYKAEPTTVELHGIQTSVEKKVTAYDYDTTSWKYTIHVPAAGLPECSFEDVFGTNDGMKQEYVPDSFKIDFDSTTNGATFKSTDSGFEVAFANNRLVANTTDYTVIMTYKTKITSDTVNASIGKKVKNTGTLKVKKASASASAERRIVGTLNKSGIPHDNEGTMTWNMIIPQSFLKNIATPSNKYVVLDSFDKDLLEIDETSIKLKSISGLKTDPVVSDFKDATDISSSIQLGEGNNNANISFLLDENISGDYFLITYNTKIIDPLLLSTQGVLTYNNKASLDNFTSPRYTSEAEVKYTNMIIDKSVLTKPDKSNKYKATFRIKVNPLELDLMKDKNMSSLSNQDGDYFIYDLPSQNLIIDYETFAIVDETTHKTLTQDQYEIKNDGQLVFVIHNKAIAGAGNGHSYIIQYQAKVTGKVGDSVEYINSASFGLKSPISDENKNHVNILASSSGGGEMISYRFKIKKVSSQNLTQGLAGATYSIYKGSYDRLHQEKNRIYKDLKTDKDGYITLKNVNDATIDIKAGQKIIIVETSAPAGYSINNSVHEIQFTDGKTELLDDIIAYDFDSTISLINDPIDNHLMINKEFYKNNDIVSNELLSAVFGLYQNNDLKYHATSFKGKAIFNNLEDGEYDLKEIATAEEYSLSTKVYKVIVDGNHIQIKEGLNVIEHVTYRNYYNFGQFSFVKYNKEEQPRALKNAVFGLYKENQLVQTSTSDDLGVVSFQNIEQGQMTLKEISAPKRYLKSLEEVNVLVDNEGKVTFKDLKDQSLRITDLETLFVNELMPDKEATTSLSVHKVDESLQPLSGACFTLYKMVNSIYEKVIVNNQGPIFEFTDLDVGQYQLVESTTPKGYITSEIIPFEIDDDLQLILNQQIQEDHTIVVVNKLIPIVEKPVIENPVIENPKEPENSVHLPTEESSLEQTKVDTSDRTLVVLVFASLVVSSLCLFVNLKNRKKDN